MTTEEFVTREDEWRKQMLALVERFALAVESDEDRQKRVEAAKRDRQQWVEIMTGATLSNVRLAAATERVAEALEKGGAR